MNRIITSALLCVAATAGILGCTAPTKNFQTTANAANAIQNRAEPVVTRAAIAQGIYELVYSDKQGVLFVASAGSFKDESVPYQILVVNPADLAVIDKIELPLRAFSLALDDAGDRLYVGNTGSGAVTVIDTRTRQIQQTWQLVNVSKGKDGRDRPEYHFRQLLLDTDNHRLYMAGFDNKESKLFVIDTQTGRIEKIIPGFGYTATGIALDAKHKRLYVSNMEGEAVVVDTASNEIVKRFDLGVEQPLNLAYDGVNHRLLAVDQGHPKMTAFQKKDMPGYESHHPGSRVVAIDLATGKTVAELEAGGPVNLKIDPARERLFVANRASGELTIFDSKGYRKLHTISLPAHPNTPALNSKTGELFVTVKNGEDAPEGSPESIARIR
ncbi:YncE family protein [Pusillimonas sp. SM2304]|uniref:YncE family protein n=1 Tax=Pusillimonas sp. SM2304 TaxID=3073241 RepID=UPI0028755977|nr:YncE family protein [Pusillimonas sp. SM2304]MDS1138986.1 YncE family protein [Pusillimonas sp. SM2304]